MYQNKKFTASLMLIAFLSLNPVLAGTNFSYQQSSIQPQVNTISNGFQPPVSYNNNEPLRGSVISVPAGASFSASTTTELNSSTLSTGDSLNMIMSNDFYYNNKLIAPAGSTISGSVIEASKAKRGGINGKLCVRFTRITTPTGQQIPISAVISTTDGSGVLRGGTKADVAKEYTKDLAAGSAVGALSGLVFGALASGDKLGRGVALGTAVGAGGGLAKSAWNKGNDVEIPMNSKIELTLTEPLTTTQQIGSTPNYSFEN